MRITRHFKLRIEGRRLVIRTDHFPLIKAMEGGEGHPPSEQSMIDETREHYPKMMHVSGKSNVVTDYLSRPPDPVTAVCASLTRSPSVRFKVEMIVAAQDASAGLDVCTRK